MQEIKNKGYAMPKKNPKRAAEQIATMKIHGAMIIEQPWALELPQDVMDGLEMASILSGLSPSLLVANILSTAYQIQTAAMKAEPKSPA